MEVVRLTLPLEKWYYDFFFLFKIFYERVQCLIENLRIK